ncbi:transcriptional regulator [Candidatus Bathyarchaeota archaeon]|mgnify:CR=1 FL=1|nr:MAG: transcriptional regulator [Candidatus Bathyarchaeota archaeon]
MKYERLTGRRGFLQIIESILLSVGEGKRKSHIMYAANLNWKQLSRYLGFLERKRVIKYSDSNDVYELTDKGVKLLEVFRELRKLLS